MPTNELKAICKTILRNGYDAYLINTPLQNEINEHLDNREFSIACDVDLETLQKLFPNLEDSDEPGNLPYSKVKQGAHSAFILPTVLLMLTLKPCVFPIQTAWLISLRNMM